MKLNVTLNDDLVERLDAFAKENYMTRSGLLSAAAVQYLNQNEMILAVKSLSFSIRKIADSGTFDEEILKELEDFERFAKLFSKQ